MGAPMDRTLLLKRLGFVAMCLGLALAVVLGRTTKTNLDPRVWFEPSYYGQFLPVAIALMLAIAGFFVAFAPNRANFNLAVFGHTASEEALFDWVGLTQTNLPKWELWLFFVISIPALWIAYSNALNQKRLSKGEAVFGIVFGAAIVLLPRG